MQQNINTSLLQDESTPISKDHLYIIYTLVCGKVNLKDKLFAYTLWSRRKIQHANKNGEFPPLDPSTELLQSFYLQDIKKIRESPTKRISYYVQAMINPINVVQRIQIDTNVTQMQQWLKAGAFPLGVWPSIHSPSLMQQIGINIATSNEQNIFSINGPPGTGKTTMLKEIVTSNIIRRAILMTEYDEPDKAFIKEDLKNPPDQYNQSFYRLKKELSVYGMIVASNNNAAVENISLELPKAIKEDRTGRFSDLEAGTNKATYFADIASKLLGKPAWGLISAKLGKRSNIKVLRERLWWADDEVTLKHYYEGDSPDWKESRRNFRMALQDVIDAQKNIALAQALLVRQEKAEADRQAAHTENEELGAQLCRQEELLKGKKEELERSEKMLTLQQQNITTLKSRLPFIKRTFWKLFKRNPVIKEWKQTENDTQETIILITRQRTACQIQEDVVQAAKTQLQLSDSNLQQAEQQLHTFNADVAPFQARFGENWTDATFWNNINKNECSQMACPWTYDEYNKLREELFYQALMLHKAFILSSNCVKQNLMRLFALWDGKFIESDRKVVYGHLLNTLQLIIPVISTTFASVQSFLQDVQAEELGILLVDEAGQATSQSALGALWRTRKAIIVGDPLQVEPIVTIPSELRRRFADENIIPAIYRIPELSVQMLADQLNPYGGYRKLNDNDIDIWLGCPLFVHRRCLDPMFQISNEIAYNDKMFNETPRPNSGEKFLLQQSTWLDIKGPEKGNKNHAVQQQIDAVVNLFIQAIDIYGGPPKLYIITPFTSVDQALKKAIYSVVKKTLPQIDLQAITDWLSENCGTIHTFQGKEANEVLLVLGCDARSGKGAAQWVGQKPNIINVAVSRARYRLGVIGDYDLWRNVPYVKTVCKYLGLQK